MKNKLNQNLTFNIGLSDSCHQNEYMLCRILTSKINFNNFNRKKTM